MSVKQVYRKEKKDWLGWLAMGAALAVSAVAEYSLAVSCGFSPALAAGVPASLDIYSIKAMQTGHDIPYAVIAMIVVQALSHLVAAGVIAVSWPLIVLVSAIAPLVLWRMQVLSKKASDPGVGVYTPQVLTAQQSGGQVNTLPVQGCPPELSTRQGTLYALESAQESVSSPRVQVDKKGAQEAAQSPVHPLKHESSAAAKVSAHRAEVHTPEEPPACPERAGVQAPVQVNTPAAHQVYTPGAQALTAQEERLSSAQAREVIKRCFREGLSTRQTAVRATRSPSYVSGVFKELRAA
ncbi:hypothetical protein ACFQ71_28070 [Streptomyces sp. NPDC056534]|uniref:hypothetical protein n=1 Tax=Streptomyces sp. NPDC056534 TaxID=3345857 RepID=UPI003682619B